ERMVFPDPVISIAVEPKTRADSDKMGVALGKFASEDPSLHLGIDEETGQTILKGMGELHLEVIINRMKTEYGIEANVGKPEVAYRETLRDKVEHVETLKKQTGGSGQFAEVKVTFEPLERGAGFIFENQITGGRIPGEYIPSIEKGIKNQSSSGVLAGYECVDFKVTLLDGKFHEVDSSAQAFEICARSCFRNAVAKSRPVLLEPMMKVEVITPDDYLGDCIGDLNRRRGEIQSQEQRGGGSGIAVVAYVPLSEMFGYIGDLRSMSAGRATFTMEFHHYSEVPNNIQETIVGS
ncbi:MAG: elongation factor G, partial [Bdellovibrionales bacterium]|nr:elongation factor G [Bdellovibrionales bacterium]